MPTRRTTSRRSSAAKPAADSDGEEEKQPKKRGPPQSKQKRRPPQKKRRPPQSPDAGSDASPSKHVQGIASAQKRKRQSSERAEAAATAAVAAETAAASARAAAASARAAADEAAAEQLEYAATHERRMETYIRKVQRREIERKKELEAAQDRERNGSATVADTYVAAAGRGEGAAGRPTRSGSKRCRVALPKQSLAAVAVATAAVAGAAAIAAAGTFTFKQMKVLEVDINSDTTNAGRLLYFDGAEDRRRDGVRRPSGTADVKGLRRGLKSFRKKFKPGGEYAELITERGWDEARVYSGKAERLIGLKNVLQRHILIQDSSGRTGDLVTDAKECADLHAILL